MLLPKQHADDIVLAVLENFNEEDSDSAWHGNLTEPAIVLTLTFLVCHSRRLSLRRGAGSSRTAPSRSPLRSGTSRLQGDRHSDTLP